jgi:hypothetical protein
MKGFGSFLAIALPLLTSGAQEVISDPAKNAVVDDAAESSGEGRQMKELGPHAPPILRPNFTQPA